MLIFIKAFIYIFYQFFKFQLSLISKPKKKIKEIESIRKHLTLGEKTKGKNKNNILLISFVHQPGFIFSDCLLVSSLKKIFNCNVHGLIDQNDEQAENFLYMIESTKNYFYKKNNIITKIKYLIYSYKYFKNLKNIDDLLNLKIDKIEVGRAIYENYIRNSNTAYISNIDFKILYFLSESCYLINFTQDLIKNNKYKYAIISERQFIPSNIIFQVSLKLGVKVISRISGPKKIGVSICSSFKDKNKSEIRLGNKMFNSLKKNKMKYSHLGYSIVKKLLDGKVMNFDRNISKNYFLNDKKKKKKTSDFFEMTGLDKNKKNCFIFSHNLLDGNLFGKTRVIYYDYITWLRDTLNYINGLNSNINWIIKEHPSDYGFTKMQTNTLNEFNKIITAKNVKFFPKNVKNSIIREIADCVVTLGGSVGMEYPCFGIPSINSAGIFYSGYGFTNDFKNKKEYFNYLKNIELIMKKKMSIHQIQKARMHYYLLHEIIKCNHNYLYDYDISRKINDDFFYKKINTILKKKNADKDFFSYFKKQINNGEKFLVNESKL